MKKIFLSIILALACVAVNANEVQIDKNRVYNNLDSIKQTIVINSDNCSYKSYEVNYLKDVLIEFKCDDNIIKFTPIKKVIVDDKIYVLGKGNYNIKMICLSDNGINIPLTSQRKLFIDNERIVEQIKNLIEDLPEINNSSRKS